MGKKLFTQEEIQQIIRLYTIEGKTQKEIGPIMGCGIKPIIRILHENNVPTNIRRTNRRLNENYFSTIDNASKAYLIGLLLADGNIQPATAEREASIRLQLLSEDKNLLEYFKNEICSDGKITDNHDNTMTFSVRSNKLANDLAKYNIIPNKTYLVETLPKNIPSQFLTDFLRGYIDGDGSLYFVNENNTFHLSITSHSLSMTDDFCKVAYLLLGTPQRIIERHSTYYNNTAKITFNGLEAYFLAKLVYENASIYCHRKYKKFLQAKEKFE